MKYPKHLISGFLEFWAMKFRARCTKIVFYTILTACFGMMPIERSEALSLSQAPLFTMNSVKPNIITVIDDSGSMDFEVVVPTNDGALWWSVDNNSFVDSGTLYDNFGGSANDDWKKFVYLFPNGTGTGNRVYSDGSHDHFAIPPFIQFGYMRSADYNKAYYDPNETYEPWLEYGVTTFDDITPSAAPSDPVEGSSTLNLTADMESSSGNYVFKVRPGMVVPKSTYYYDGSWHTALSDITMSSIVNMGVRYYPATYYQKVTTGTYTVNGTAGNCSTPNTAHYTIFKGAPSTFVSTDADALAYDGGCLKKVEIKSANAPFANDGGRTDCADTVGNTCTYDEEIQNFANWYSYYRKRHLALRAGMGRAFDGITDVYTGMFTINHRSDVTMLDFDTDSDTFYSNLYNIGGNAGGTPNRAALDFAGQQYKRTDAGAPIIEECQKNFTIHFTDGFATLSGTSVGNQDGGTGAPYEDSYSNTLADVAMKYYSETLRTGSDFPTGEVPIASGCSETTPDPKLDCNPNLHMNTYTIGLGAKGTLYGVTHFDVQDAYDTTPVWPNANAARDPTQVDDLYHAAVDGRGEMYNAETTKELQTKLNAALLSIKAQIGSGATATFNTTTLEENSKVYLSLFDSTSWSGDLIAYQLNPTNGNIVSTPDWRAATLLDDRDLSSDPRTIITHNGTDGIAFDWSVISALGEGDILYDDLNFGEPVDADPAGEYGQSRLEYIRGDRSNEGTGMDYRVRESRLGDAVHSSAVYVGKPTVNWPDTAPFPDGTTIEQYSDFSSANIDRDPVIYVGANDGMLHGFDADTGEEVLAYIPRAVSSDLTSQGLHYLTQTDYSHRYYVDITPTISDAVIDGGWKTVLVGSLGAGGRGIFALDITDPTTFSEANAADIVLWEFTSEDDPDLGYTYSEPVVVRTNNDKWAVIFGNGYEGGNTAVLFILYISEGTDGEWSVDDYKKIDTGVGTSGNKNGLSSPAVVDTSGDGNADRVYAGDLYGNMWVFDISHSNSNQWSVKKLFTAQSGQAITTAPVITTHPTVPDGNDVAPNLMVYFGTGQYLTLNDTSDDTTQSFYGIWDNDPDDPGYVLTDLQQQTITQGDGVNGLDVGVRLLSNETVDYTDEENPEYGWYFNLPDSGERVVVNGIARGDYIYFNTTVPTDDPCGAGGYGWQMVVDAAIGGRPPADSPVFDYNNDGVVDLDDIIDYLDDSWAPSGVQFDGGQPSGPAILADKEYTTSTNTKSGDEIDIRGIESLKGLNTGRLSWEELFY